MKNKTSKQPISYKETIRTKAAYGNDDTPRLNPLAKNPPNGPISEANVDSAMLCIWNGYIFTVSYEKNNSQDVSVPLILGMFQLKYFKIGQISTKLQFSL